MSRDSQLADHAQGQYRLPHPSPQLAERRDRAQRAHEGDWQAATAPAGGDLGSPASAGRIVGHRAPEAEPAAGTRTVQVAAPPGMWPPGPPAADCAVQEVAPCNTAGFTHSLRVPNLPEIHPALTKIVLMTF
jgi:hypothetical protein